MAEHLLERFRVPLVSSHLQVKMRGLRRTVLSDDHGGADDVTGGTLFEHKKIHPVSTLFYLAAKRQHRPLNQGGHIIFLGRQVNRVE